MTPDERVPGFLGRILNAAGGPEGTCFQVAPGVFVTAWHVLRNVSAGTDTGDIGGLVRVDPLGGGGSFAARVINVDRVHDLGVLRAERSLPAVVPGVAVTDDVELRAEVAVTGSVYLPDDQEYRFLDAPGRWAGGTTRGGVRLGRLTASDVMRGMSGAPVLGVDNIVVGVVSARYNTDDNWGRDTVWVARTEDLRLYCATSVSRCGRGTKPSTSNRPRRVSAPTPACPRSLRVRPTGSSAARS